LKLDITRIKTITPINYTTMNWSKEELKIYILLHCAYADDEASPEEISVIKANTATEYFDAIQIEFQSDTSEVRLERIENAVSNCDYGIIDLIELRNEIHQVFMADKVFNLKERNLERLLDNLIY